MVMALVRESIDELAIFIVPRVVYDTFPPELLNDYCFWPMTTAVTLQQDTLPVGPMRNIEYAWLLEPADTLKVVLRHPCDECQSALEEAAEHLRTHPGDIMCVGQATVDYLMPPGATPRRFTIRRDA